MSALATIFMGDLIRAVSALDADEATAVAIGRLLGITGWSAELERQNPEWEGTSAPAGPQHSTERQPLSRILSNVVAEPLVMPEWSRQRESADALPTGSLQVQKLGRSRRAADPQSRPSTVLPRPDPRAGAEPPEPEPLLLPAGVRGLLTRILSVMVDEGPLDVERMVERAAVGEPLVEIRSPLRTMRYGLQVLVDLGDGMLPFAQDAAILQRDIERVAGEHLQILRFAGCPSLGVGTGPRPWGRYVPPAPPTPVLAITDLGLAPLAFAQSRSTMDDWLSFAGLLGRYGCPLIALVPYPEARIPLPLMHAMTVIPWDRSTTVQTVGRILARR